MIDGGDEDGRLAAAREAIMRRSAEDYRLVADLYREFADRLEVAGSRETLDGRLAGLNDLREVGQKAVAGFVGLVGCALVTADCGTEAAQAAVDSEGRILFGGTISVLPEEK